MSSWRIKFILNFVEDFLDLFLSSYWFPLTTMFKKYYNDCNLIFNNQKPNYLIDCYEIDFCKQFNIKLAILGNLNIFSIMQC